MHACTLANLYVLPFLLLRQQFLAGMNCVTVWLMIHVTHGSTSKPEVQMSLTLSQLLTSFFISAGLSFVEHAALCATGSLPVM